MPSACDRLACSTPPAPARRPSAGAEVPAAYQPRSIHSWRWGASVPMVVESPWPGRTRVSAGRVAKSRSSMDRMIVGKSPPGKLGGAGAAREQGVAAEEHRGPLQAEAHGAGRVPGRQDGVQPEAADLDGRPVLEDEVVGRQHRRVRGGDADLVAGIPHGRHGLDVVPVAVGLEHLANPEPAAQVEQLVVLVGRVEQDGVAGLLAAQHVDVVVHRPDDHLMDLGLAVLVMHAAQPMD